MCSQISAFDIHNCQNFFLTMQLIEIQIQTRIHENLSVIKLNKIAIITGVPRKNGIIQFAVPEESDR